MGELRKDLAPVPVDRVHQTGEPRQHAVVVDANLAGRVPAPRMAEHVAGQDQADLVRRERLVDLDEVVGDLSRVCGGRLRRAGANDAIGGGDTPDPARLEQDARHGRRS